MKKYSFETLQKQQHQLSKEALKTIKGGTVVNFLEIQSGGTFTVTATGSNGTNG